MTPAGFGAADALALFGHHLLWSLLAVGGAIATAPDMHRYLVVERGWLDDTRFTDSIALAQAAPGPNLLFVAVLGYHVAGLAGAALAMLGILLPSTTLALAVARFGARRREHRAVRAFSAGMAPLTVGLVAATGWLLTEPTRGQPLAWALLGLTVAGTAARRVHPMVLIAVGAVVGAIGGV